MAHPYLSFYGTGRYFLIFYLCAAAIVLGENRQELKIQLVNGTSRQPVSGGEVQLLKGDGQGMTVVRTMRTDAGGECLLPDWEMVKQTPHVLQSSYRGVLYSLSLQQLRGPEIAVLTVYETTEKTEPLKVGLPHMMVRRDGPVLEINEVYQVENRTDPPHTMFAKEGTFRFHLPRGASLIKAACSSGGSLMPRTVPVHPSRDGEEFRTDYALKPGSNLVQIAYRLDYSAEQARLNLKYFYPLTLFHMMLAPGDIRVDAAFLKEAGEDVRRNMRLFAARTVPANQELILGLSGGSPRPPEVSDEDMPGKTATPESPADPAEEEEQGGGIVPLPPRIANYRYLILGNLLVLLGAFLGWAYSNRKSCGGPNASASRQGRSKAAHSQGSH